MTEERPDITDHPLPTLLIVDGHVYWGCINSLEVQTDTEVLPFDKHAAKRWVEKDLHPQKGMRPIEELKIRKQTRVTLVIDHYTGKTDEDGDPVLDTAVGLHDLPDKGFNLKQ